MFIVFVYTSIYNKYLPDIKTIYEKCLKKIKKKKLKLKDIKEKITKLKKDDFK
jgi:hypothetical protein